MLVNKWTVAIVALFLVVLYLVRRRVGEKTSTPTWTGTPSPQSFGTGPASNTGSAAQDFGGAGAYAYCKSNGLPASVCEQARSFGEEYSVPALAEKGYDWLKSKF